MENKIKLVALDLDGTLLDSKKRISPGNLAALSRLRQLYLPARYKGQATQQDAQEAKALYQQIKKQ